MGRKWTDISIDIETLGEVPGSIVGPVGLVAFDRRTDEIGPTLLVRPSMIHQERLGLKMTTSTFRWWLRQSEEARAEMADDVGHSVPYALGQISTFMRENLANGGCVWAKGPSFDFSILPWLARAENWHPLWKFPTERCVRTIADIAGIEHTPLPEGEAHTALADALAQARTVQRAVAVLGDRSDPSRWLDVEPAPADIQEG